MINISKSRLVQAFKFHNIRKKTTPDGVENNTETHTVKNRLSSSLHMFLKGEQNKM